MVVEDDRCDVEALAGHGPPRLDRVQRASVGLEGHHSPVRGGDGCSDCHGQALPDGPTGQAEPVVRGRTSGRPGGEEAGRVPLVGNDGALGQKRTEGLADGLRCQGT